jgi:hypothetical protein
MLVVTDPPEGQWSQPPAFPDGGAGLVSSVDDMVAFGRMLLRGGSPVLKSTTVAEMTRDQLTPEQRRNVWPGFSFLEDRGWGYGVSVLDDGRYTWEGGFGTAGRTCCHRTSPSWCSPSGPPTRPGCPPSATTCWRPPGPPAERGSAPSGRFRLLAVMRS